MHTLGSPLFIKKPRSNVVVWHTGCILPRTFRSYFPLLMTLRRFFRTTFSEQQQCRVLLLMWHIMLSHQIMESTPHQKDSSTKEVRPNMAPYIHSSTHSLNNLTNMYGMPVVFPTSYGQAGLIRPQDHAYSKEFSQLH